MFLKSVFPLNKKCCFWKWIMGCSSLIIFCGSHELMDTSFKPEQNDLLGLLWHGPCLVLQPKFSRLPLFHATFQLVQYWFLRSNFCFEMSFFPLSTQLMLPPTRCWYQHHVQGWFQGHLPSQHRLCFKRSSLWSLSTQYIHRVVFALYPNTRRCMYPSPDLRIRKRLFMI